MTVSWVSSELGLYQTSADLRLPDMQVACLHLRIFDEIKIENTAIDYQ